MGFTKFSFKYLALLCLLTNSALNASNNDTVQSNKYAMLYISNASIDNRIQVSEELLNRYPIFNCTDDFIKIAIRNFGFEEEQKNILEFYEAYDIKNDCDKLNNTSLSINISHSLFLFRLLVKSMKQFQDDLKTHSVPNNPLISIEDNVRNGFSYVFEHIIDRLIYYKASNSKLPEQTISNEAKQKLIMFKEKYGEVIHNIFSTNSKTSINKIDEVYNEFNKILTEENNKISHTYDS